MELGEEAHYVFAPFTVGDTVQGHIHNSTPAASCEGAEEQRGRRRERERERETKGGKGGQRGGGAEGERERVSDSARDMLCRADVTAAAPSAGAPRCLGKATSSSGGASP
ncbi:hypothetical protein EYF80_046663 [Liparis tanakae]|uniref:Uncharacterized protein n=1 Tax=Liparis tanakae TaxID=230148 RepID=A0A4Z2FQ49_9TELE|nr:hypothetical protein EYF80_046663 [Liparis tanakae]